MKRLKYIILTVMSLSVFAHSSQKQSTPLKGLKENIPIAIIDDVQMSINIAFPEIQTVEPRSVLILIHGGGFISDDKSSKNKHILKF